MRWWTTLGWAAAAVMVAAQSRPGSAAAPAAAPPIRIHLWGRGGNWTATTTATLKDFGFGFQDLHFTQSGGDVTGKFLGGSMQAFATEEHGGLVLAGVYHFDDGYAPDAKFVVRMADKKSYDRFVGKVQYTPEGATKPKWYTLVGSYEPDLEQEKGRALLEVHAYAVKPQHSLSPKNAVVVVSRELYRRDLPVKVAFLVFVRNSGERAFSDMLPDGMADLVLRVSPNVGCSLPLNWNGPRTTNPGTYRAVGEAWEMRVPLGALATKKDGAWFAVEADMAREFVGTKLQLDATVEPRAPNLKINSAESPDDPANATVEISIYPDPV